MQLQNFNNTIQRIEEILSYKKEKSLSCSGKHNQRRWSLGLASVGGVTRENSREVHNNYLHLLLSYSQLQWKHCVNSKVVVKLLAYY